MYNRHGGHIMLSIETTNTNLHMPCLAQSMNHTLLDGPAAGTTYGYAHLVMATQAVQFSILFTGLGIQLNTVTFKRKKQTQNYSYQW